MSSPQSWLPTAEAAARFGISLVAGQWPTKLGCGLLAFFVFTIGKSIIRDAMVPVFKAIGEGLAARITARLLPPEQHEHQALEEQQE